MLILLGVTLKVTRVWTNHGVTRTRNEKLSRCCSCVSDGQNTGEKWIVASCVIRSWVSCIQTDTGEPETIYAVHHTILSIMCKLEWFRRRKKSTSTGRTVFANQGPACLLNDGEEMKQFCSNAIISARYTWLNFVPKNLFEQFHNMANIFFATITVPYAFAEAATSVWSNLGPLIAILVMTMIKDGIEDILRHRRDRKVNHRLVQTLNVNPAGTTPEWVVKRAMNLRVGDVICCERDQSFPCDLVVLASSNTSTEINVTTTNLDGESNIKKYYAVSSTQPAYLKLAPDRFHKMITNSSHPLHKMIKSLYVRVECEQPNADLTKFEGRLSTKYVKDIPLSTSNVALRGAKLRNTDFMLGMVVYTGEETKLSLNGKKSARKYTTRESRSNVILLSFIVSMVLLAVIFATVFTLWTGKTKNTIWYIPTSPQTSWQFIQNLFRFVFILNYLIPISIVITIELQQLLLAFLISQDMKMYLESEDLCAKANSSQLADELGQVEFLFSDKTGTLTLNSMRLCLCGILESEKVYTFRPLSATSSNTSTDFCAFETVWDRESNSSQSDTSDSFPNKSTIHRQWLIPDANDTLLQEFLTTSALCHTLDVANTEIDGEYQNGRNEISLSQIPIYEASSPDEKALVEGAAQNGVVFVGVEPVEDSISTKRYKIEYRNGGSTNDNAAEQKCYLVDAVLEFTSERKRMTVMVRYPDGTYHIHSKGAESTMLTPENCPATSGGLRTQAIKYVTDFAVEGYRTLVFSSRQLEEAEYRTLLTDLHKASGLVGSERATAMQNAYAAIETNLSPKFVTAVEDQLQPGVKECLKNLREAGIQVWILTGDKEETAITVSQAAGHFTQQMSLLRLTHCPDFETAACMVFEQLEGLQSRTDERRLSRGKALTSHTEKFYPQITATAEEVDDALYAVAEEVLSSEGENASKINRIKNLQRKMLSLTRTKITSRTHRRKHRRRPGCGGEPIGLVIDGKTLSFMLQPSLREAFLDLCMNVTTVLCCRMTPLQKASIVQLVQFGLSVNSIGGGGPPVTAAVGDGGNDVAMILQASVGVGIYGKEGLEAARAADYSIPQFRHLTRLFLLHGHWSYHRISFTMNLFYFKCTALVTTQIMLNFYGGFSQTVSYSSLMFALFNLTMTSLTCLLYGIFEQHLPENALLARPYLYRLVIILNVLRVQTSQSFYFVFLCCTPEPVTPLLPIYFVPEQISQQANLKLWYVMIWIVEGVWHGIITFIMTFFALGGGFYAPASFYDSGLSSRATYDLYFLGIANFIFLWISVSVRILTLSRCINTGVLIGYGITLINIVLFYPDQPAAFVGLFLSPAFWFTLILTVVLANMPGLIWRILSDAWWTVQIELSKISSKRMRHKLLRSFRVWLSAIIWGDRDLTTSDIKEDE
ncbi:phospholipid-translocating P-type ATPase, flippase, partial [Opisthorchis viverrini]